MMKNYLSGNFAPIIKKVYNTTIRPLALRIFGPQVTNMSGVDVRYQAITDLQRSIDFKLEMVELVQELVETEDSVIEIGSGYGVLTVHAAQKGGRVTGYEGSAKMVTRARETLERNGVAGQVEIHHAIVGEAVDVFGDTHGADIISPSELSGVDVLIMDCEGSEISIIQELSCKPNTIIVESHPPKGAATEDVKSELLNQGYQINNSIIMGQNGKHAVAAKYDHKKTEDTP